MRWIIPKTKQDQEIRVRPTEQPEPEAGSVFNVPLAGNDGGVSVIDLPCKTLASPGQREIAPSGQYDADEDIRAGRVKQFDNPEDMIASLKEPWQD